MEHSYQDILSCIQAAVNDSELTSGEIPSIDLYIDQIINLLESAMSSNKRREEDKLLTKTMINNYSKEGLLKPIKGKKYSKEHIIQMLIIYELKQVLSIGDIKTVLDQYNKNESFDSEAFIGIYDQFLALKGFEREVAVNFSQQLLGQMPQNLQQERKLFLLILAFANLSKYMKRICETLIDTYLEKAD